MIPFPNDPLTHDLDIYIVGGAVRDYILKGEISDIDWVVVGATPETMTARGFTPVGADFPVFLHPLTHQEFALARTERKTAKGYRGFVVHADEYVTLEQDLMRRDLTINAIAQSRDGQLIDPYGGLKDIKEKSLRHVSDAFNEDPVRILRLARFKARFPEFNVHPETLALCKGMVSDGEVDALVPERVWAELSRGLMCVEPQRMLKFLNQINALERLIPLPGVEGAWNFSTLESLDGLGLAERYALFAFCRFEHTIALTEVSEEHDDHVKKINQHLKVPSECADMARCLIRLYLAYYPYLKYETYNRTSKLPLSVDDTLQLLQQLDAFRKPERFLQTVALAQRLPTLGDIILPPVWWRQALEQLNTIDAKALVAQYSGDGIKIKEAIHQARLQVLTDYFRAT